MAKHKNRNNPYAKKRQGKAKPAVTPAFEKELANRKRSRGVIIVVAILAFVMVGSMFSQGLATKGVTTYKPNFDNASQTETTYASSRISFGQSLNRIEDKYYVLVGEATSVASANAFTKDLPVYIVDSALPVNKEVISDLDKVVALPTSLSEIKLVEDVALLTVENGKIISYVQGLDKIEKSLK